MNKAIIEFLNYTNDYLKCGGRIDLKIKHTFRVMRLCEEIASSLNLSVEVTIMEMVAANGLVNLFTPTCGAIMGGLALAKVEYTTWLKWVWKVVLVIALANILLLTIAMLIL